MATLAEQQPADIRPAGGSDTLYRWVTTVDHKQIGVLYLLTTAAFFILGGIEALLASPLADAAGLGLSERATRDALRVVTASYEYNGGFRLRTLSA